MNCKEIIQKISEFIDGELEFTECESIKAHSETCENCQSFISSFTKNIELCKDLLKVDMPDDIKDRLRQRLQDEYKRYAE